MRAAQFLAIIGRGSKGSNALELTEDRAGATSEQQDNVINTVNSLDPYGPSWQLVPGNVAAGTVYAQVPTSGTGDLAFTRASTKTRTNASGNVVGVASGVAAIDYRNADGSLSSTGRLFLELQRTNLALYSEQFETSWTAQTATITSNATTAPNGTLTADKLVAAVGLGLPAQHRIDQTSTSAAGNNTFSVYAKKGEIEFIFLRIGLSGAIVNLNNGAISNITAGIVASSVDAGNGWYRLIITKAASIANEVLRINLNQTATFTDFIGNGTDGAFIWGAQYEAGAYATTYIPTTTAAVTRLVDAFSLSNIYTNGLISAAGGTWFLDMANIQSLVRANTSGLFIGDSVSPNAGNQFIIRNPSIGRLFISKVISGVPTSLFTLTTDAAKIAINWNGTTANLFVNGVKQVSATDFTTTIMENMVAGVPVPFYFNEMALFPVPLTDDQCIEMTTL